MSLFRDQPISTVRVLSQNDVSLIIFHLHETRFHKRFFNFEITALKMIGTRPQISIFFNFRRILKFFFKFKKFFKGLQDATLFDSYQRQLISRSEFSVRSQVVEFWSLSPRIS